MNIKYLVYVLVALIISGGIVASVVVNNLLQIEKQRQQIELQQRAESEKELSKNKQLKDCIDSINEKVSNYLEANKGAMVDTEDAKVMLDLIDSRKEECYRLYQ